jgi:catechol 2,3-dioxygenase-like lactoylglutathione lyase family enzyme
VKGAGPETSLQLAVADLNTTEAFYAGILDLPVKRGLTVPGAPEYLVLKHDAWEVIFVEEASVIRTHPLLEERLTSYPKGVGLTLHFRVTEIEDINDAIIEEDLEILYPLDEKPYGMKDLWCFDPDGYLVVLEEPSE